MDNFNIRITRRTEVDNRAREESIDIDFCRDLAKQSDIADYQSCERLAQKVTELAGGDPYAKGDEAEFVPANREEMQDTLSQLSQELGCTNTLEDMLFAIDALRNTKPEPALEWSKTLCAGERVNHAKAIETCTSLGEGWRLPTRAELLSLVDDTRYDPAIDSTRFPDTESAAYWTSTPFASDPSFAWIVDFYDGYASYYHRNGSYAFVRAVRSVPAGQ